MAGVRNFSWSSMRCFWRSQTGRPAGRVSHVGSPGDAHGDPADIIRAASQYTNRGSAFALCAEPGTFTQLLQPDRIPLIRSGKFSVEKYNPNRLQLLEKFGYHAGGKPGIPDLLTKFFFWQDRTADRQIDR